MNTQINTENNNSVIYKAYIRHLEGLPLSTNTIRNYKSDFEHFIRWLKVKIQNTEMLDKTILLLNEQTIDEYKQFMISSLTPRLTVNRRLTSIRLLATYLLERNYISTDFAKNTRNIKNGKINTHTVTPFYKPLTLPATNNDKAKPAVPILITAAAIILLLLQVILKERPASPWSNVIAKQEDNVAAKQIEHITLGNTHEWEDKQISIRLSPDSKDIFFSAKPILIDENQIVLEMTSKTKLQEKRSGKGIINANTNSTIIYNSLVTPDSIINITPTSSTSNQIIYIKRQQEGMFVVGFDEIVNQKVNFNWEIVSN